MGESLTVDERRTMLGLLEYPNPLGIDRTEARWRDFSRVELGLRDIRIRQLEDLNAKLAAEVDAMRPVVEAAVKWNTTNYRDTEEIEFALDKLGEVCDDYESSKAK